MADDYGIEMVCNNCGLRWQIPHIDSSLMGRVMESHDLCCPTRKGQVRKL